MALQLSHTVRGIKSDAAYVKLAQTNLDHVARTGQITLNIYFNKAARDAAPVANVIDQKSYTVTPELYAEYFTESADIRAQSYELAKSVRDQGDAPKEGEEDARVSYFATAKDV